MSTTAKDEHAIAEEGHAGAQEASTKGDAPSSKKLILAGGALLLAVIALSVGLPLGLKNRRNNNNKDVNDTNESSSLSSTNSLAETGSERTSRRSLPTVSLSTLRETYPSCAELELDLKIATSLMVNRTIESNIQNYFYSKYNGGGIVGPIFGGGGIQQVAQLESSSSDRMFGTQAVPAPAPPSSPIATSESSFESNNQEEGVDEPDVVKSDGTFVFAAYGEEIVKLSVDQPKIVSRTKIQVEDENCGTNYVSDMLLIDEKLVVISSGWCKYYVDAPIGGTSDERSSTVWRGGSGRSITRITMFDKATLDAIGDPIDMKGSYNSARAVDGDVYVVTTNSITYYNLNSKFDIWDSLVYGKRPTEEDYREKAWGQVDLYLDTFVTQLVEDFKDCGSVQRLALFQNKETDSLTSFGGVMESIASVTSFNVDTPTIISAKSLILPYSGWMVYASQTQLVLAAQGWWFRNNEDTTQETYVITYNLDNAVATVQGFGSVPGYVLNQFSIDHQVQNGNDYLYFATSTRARWGMEKDEEGHNTWVRQDNSTSQITVLKVPQAGDLVDKMEVVGQLEGLGKPGERIYSVRFQKNRSFVVTFEETDPFYTIDLTDPANPTQVGELEIPGFSSYLHPIGENLILGVGQNVDPDTGRREGLQISVFDVSDFANPVRTQIYTETSEGSSGSAAEYDHMAFRYLDDSGLLILPVTLMDWQRRWGQNEGEDGGKDEEIPFDGFKVYTAGSEGISEYHNINHETRSYYELGNCWSTNYQARGGNLSPRSLVFSGVLWTMKDHTLQVNDLSTRETTSTPVDFDENIDKGITCNEVPQYLPRPFPEVLDEEQLVAPPLPALIITDGVAVNDGKAQTSNTP